jgi:hypothetical protein
MLINLEISSKYASQNALKSLKINEKSLSGLPAQKLRIIGSGPFRGACVTEVGQLIDAALPIILKTPGLHNATQRDYGICAPQ